MKAEGTRVVRRTQAERSAKSEERMLNAAEELFAEQGLIRTTLIDIGRRAGYSGGLATHRFGSKHGILKALVERYRKIVDETYREHDEDGTLRPTTLRAFIDRYFQAGEGELPRRRAIHVLMGESLGPLRECLGLFADYNLFFIGVIEAAVRESQRRGLVRSDIDAGKLAVTVITGLRGSMLLWHSDPDHFPLPMLARAFWQSIEWTLTDAGLEDAARHVREPSNKLVA